MGNSVNSAENAEEEKKKKKKLLIPIIILASVLLLGGTAGVLAGLGVFGGKKGPETDATESTEEPSSEELENEIQLWWNVDREKYAGQSAIGTSSREVDEDDGYYHVLFTTDGRQVTRRIAEKKVLNVVDSNDLMALEFDDKGIIVGIKRIEDVTGGYEVQGWYVSEIAEDGTIILNTSASYNGMDMEFEIPDTAMILDVSGAINFIGMEIKKEALQKGDRIYAVKNLEGTVYRVFVTERYIKPEIYWNVSRQYDSELLATKRVPNENGEYVFEMACNGEQLIVKTKSQKLATSMDKQAAKCMGLTFDSEGYVNKVTAAGTATGGGSCASWYHILELDGNKMHAKKFSGSDNGKEFDGELADDFRAFDVSGDGEFVGVEIFDLRVSDQVHCLRDQSGKVSIAFVVGRRKDCTLVWNISKKYDSTNKVSTRKPENGWYIYDVCIEGVRRKIKTNDKAIADQMDSYAAKCFGVVLNGDVVTKVYAAKSVTGGSSFASWYDVKSFDGKNIHAVKTSGEVADGVMADGCKVINVGGMYSKSIGEFTTLRVNDRIHGLKDYKGEIAVIFVVTRKAPDITAYCQECGKTVTWSSVSGEFAAQKDSAGNPLALSHFYVPQNMSLTTQGSTPYKSTKTPKADGTTSTTYSSTSDVHLDLRGYTLSAYENARAIALFGAGVECTIFDSSAAKTGCIKAAGGRANDRGAFFWIMSGNSKLVVKDITLDMSSVNVPSTKGGIYNGNSTSSIELTNVKIKGGYTEYGSVIYSTGPVTLTDVTITGGTSKTNGSVYVTGTLTLNGNTSVTGGKLEDGSNANIYLASGKTIATTSGLTSADGAIGVTTVKAGAFTTSKFAGLDTKFFGDAKGSTVEDKSGTLYLNYTYDGIKFANTNETLSLGEAKAFKVQTTPVSSDGLKCTFESSDPEIVFIDANGTAIGVKQSSTPVTVKATATVDGETFTAECQVTVGPAQGALDHYHAEDTHAAITGDSSEKAKIQWTAWTDATKLPTTSGYYYLATDVATTGQFSMTADQNLHICLNGHSIKSSASTRTISLHNTGCALGICDCSADESGAVYGATGDNEWTQGRTVWVRYGHFEFFGGTLYGVKSTYCNTSTTSAGRVSTKNPWSGGTVYVTSTSTFDMYGGTIRDGYAVSSMRAGSDGVEVLMKVGGGNVLNCGTFNMYDGLITDGYVVGNPTDTSTSTWGYGGNIYIAGTGTMNMYGGTVSDGISTGHGGNIYAEYGGTFNMYDGLVTGGKAGILHNASTGENTPVAGTWRVGGNIYVTKSGATFSTANLYGGTVSGGYAVQGGNIYSNGQLNIKGEDGKPFVLTSGEAKSNGGNICFDTSAKAEFEYALIEDGITGSTGANIYGKPTTLTVKDSEFKGGKATSYGSIYLTSGTITDIPFTFENVKVEKLEECGTTTYPKRCAVALNAAEAIFTVKDSEMAALDIVTAKSVTLDGKLTLGDDETTGLYVDNATGGSKIALGDNFDETSEITVGSGFSGTVVTNGAEYIDCFTQTNGTEYVLRAAEDGKALELVKGAITEAHKHCICGGVMDDDTKEVSSHVCDATQEWQAWTDTESVPMTSGYYYLTEDIALSAYAVFPSDVDINICLNGHTITAPKTRTLSSYGKSGSENTSTYHTNIKLTFTDCQEKCGTITNSQTSKNENGGYVIFWPCEGGELNIYNGNITSPKRNAESKGAMIALSKGGCLNMYGGTISGGYSTSAGGNISTGSKGDITIYGGTIEGGETLSSGGNIYVAGAVLTIKGGTIKDGVAATGITAHAGGGNIYASDTNGTELHISGGEILNGYAGKDVAKDLKVYAYGGNIRTLCDTEITGGIIAGGTCGTDDTYLATFDGGGNIYASAKLTISGDAEIYGGTAKASGGNINAGGEFIMTGGKIYDGEVLKGSGGNLYTDASSKGVMRIEGGEIYGGKAENGGNIFNKSKKTGVAQFTLAGGKIYDGTATNGGNIYLQAATETVPYIAAFEGGEVYGGTARMGGNIYARDNAGGMTVTMKDTKVYEGTALSTATSASYGGNIYFYNNVDKEFTATIEDCEIYDGIAKPLEDATLTCQGGNIMLYAPSAGAAPVVTITGETKIYNTDASEYTTLENCDIHVEHAQLILDGEDIEIFKDAKKAEKNHDSIYISGAKGFVELKALPTDASITIHKTAEGVFSTDTVTTELASKLKATAGYTIEVNGDGKLAFVKVPEL